MPLKMRGIPRVSGQRMKASSLRQVVSFCKPARVLVITPHWFRNIRNIRKIIRNIRSRYSYMLSICRKQFPLYIMFVVAWFTWRINPQATHSLHLPIHYISLSSTAVPVRSINRSPLDAVLLLMPASTSINDDAQCCQFSVRFFESINNITWYGFSEGLYCQKTAEFQNEGHYNKLVVLLGLCLYTLVHSAIKGAVIIREIMYLLASVRPSVRLCPLSWLNRLTVWYVDWTWPWLAWLA